MAGLVFHLLNRFYLRNHLRGFLVEQLFQVEGHDRQRRVVESGQSVDVACFLRKIIALVLFMKKTLLKSYLLFSIESTVHRAIVYLKSVQ